MYVPWFTYLLPLVVSIASLYLWPLTSLFLSSFDDSENSTIYQVRPSSSVWCTNGPSKERLCKFRNICYDPRFREFQFLLTADSIISGIEKPSSWMNIELSTVIGHNSFRMKISILKTGHNNLKKFPYITYPTFIVHRFKSDNIMHVLHDELIPLHFTYESLSLKHEYLAEKASMAFTDLQQESPLLNWYRLYSKRNIILLPELNSTICFVDAYIGLLRNTLWYKYGFGEPHGPFLNKQFSARGIRSFVNDNLKLWNSASLTKRPSAKSAKIVVIVRNVTRRILNPEVIIEASTKAHHDLFPDHSLQIVVLDLALHNVTYMVSQINTACLLVGMHGAGMILSLFLPPWASVVELFPYGLNPDHVSFLYALTLQSDLYPLHYIPWQNAERKNSFPGPQVDPLMGKISHLPQEEQTEIKALSEVPAVHCCHNPAYLYYMYHDTMVSENIIHAIRSALSMLDAKRDLTSKHSDIQIYPSLLSHISCEIHMEALTVRWGEIGNLKDIEYLWFQITIQNGNDVIVKDESNSMKREFSLTIESLFKIVHVWIQPHNGHVGGHSQHAKCSQKN